MKRTIAQCLALMLVAAFTVQTATAMTVAEEMGWYDYAINPYEGYGGSDDSGGPTCGSGTKTLCATLQTKTCSEYQPATGPFRGVQQPTCKTWVTLTEYKHYP